MLSALETAAAVRSGETTALEQVEAAIGRIEAGNAAINAVVVKDYDRAREQARAIDAGGVAKDAPLLGVPMTVKESYAVAGLPATWGYAEHEGTISHADAVAIQRLKAAGAVILGKTNVPTGLIDLQSNNPVYGRTLNPLNHERSPGGSSGGAAASLAAGFVPAEIGSDIGGSIRTPAAFCGVWGHKPTYGVIAPEGHNFPGTDSARVALGVMGPLARDPADLATLLDVLTDLPLPRFEPRDPSALSILILPEHPVARATAEMRRTVELVGQAFERAGAEVERTLDPFPDLAAQHANYIKMLLTALSRGAPGPSGKTMSLAGWFALQDEQARCIRAWQRLLRDYDAVIAPVFGATAFPHDDTPTDERVLMLDGAQTPFGVQFAYAGLATFPNLPATSVPVATGADGMPIGLQVIGDLYQDHKTIAIARMANALMRN
jgi:amidase